MPHITTLPHALAARGCRVELVSGWQTRGSSSFNPRGAVAHWTAGPRTGDRPSLSVCVNGRPGLPGPLCNVFLSRSGVAVVVAAGRANHAGTGGYRGLVGNSAVFGTEAENSGGGEWTAEQRYTYPRINAAYADLGAPILCGHNEWAPSRKIDIRDYTMDRLRAEVAAIRNDPTTPPMVEVTPGDDMAKILRVSPDAADTPGNDGLAYVIDEGMALIGGHQLSSVQRIMGAKYGEMVLGIEMAYYNEVARAARNA